jgi:UDP-3-O-[3-hydroxymyristoyl] glucosamine N-acyltransferase
MKFTAEQIALLLEGKVEGNGQVEVSTLSKIEEADTGSISFLSNPKYEPYLYKTKASAVIISEDLALKQAVKPAIIRVKDPYSGFTRLLEEYHKIISFQAEGIEEPSFIGKNSTVGEKAYRAAFSYIGKNCQIGQNVKIYPHTFIGDNCTIGDNTIILAGAKIYAETKIGSNCTIHAGAVIGSDGFGFAPQADGSYKTIPQLGNVVLEDWVSVGANATIDCATLGSTVIRRGVKLDNLVQIGHNVEVDEHTVIAAQSGVAGSSKIGKQCVLAGQVGVVGHLSIADRTTIAAQAGVPKTVTKPGQTIIGSPAFDLADFKRSFILFKNLPNLATRLKEVEEKVVTLQPNDSNS